MEEDEVRRDKAAAGGRVRQHLHVVVVVVVTPPGWADIVAGARAAPGPPAHLSSPLFLSMCMSRSHSHSSRLSPRKSQSIARSLVAPLLSSSMNTLACTPRILYICTMDIREYSSPSLVYKLHEGEEAEEEVDE